MVKSELPPMLDIDGVLVSMDCITEEFCCDLSQCHGKCCIEGDAGAPVTLDEIMEIEDALDEVWNELSAQAQSVIDKQGVSYIDQTGELVTSIVNNKDCVFTCHEGDCCFCSLEKAYRNGKSEFPKPISCALYPIREKKLFQEKKYHFVYKPNILLFRCIEDFLEQVRILAYHYY